MIALSSFNLIFLGGSMQEPSGLLSITTSATQLELSSQTSQQKSLVSVSSGSLENWGESNMADASPRTDISTDADTDEKNKRVISCSP